MKPVLNKKYLHYKGGLYEVLHLAQDTVTKKDVVVYKSLHYGTYFTRPLDEWFDKVTKDDKILDRFELYYD